MNKKILAIALSAGLLFTGCNNQTQNNNEVVATVNDKGISKKDYLETMKTFSMFASARQGMKTPVVDMMVENEIILKDLKDNEIEITDEDVQKNIDTYVATSGGKENFDKMLSDYNLNLEDLKKYVRYETVAQKHMDWYNKEHQPSDDEINKYFEENKDYLVQVKAQHILVDSEEKANEAKARIDKGEKFEDVAKDMSIDEFTKDEGGDLGFIYKNQMDKDFEKVAFELKDGQVSGPVKTSFGYHIIKVTESKKEVKDVKDVIVETLNRDAYRDYLEQLKAKAKVEVKDKEKAGDEDDTLLEDKEELEKIKEDTK